MVVGPSSFPISCPPIFGVDPEAANGQATSLRAARPIPATPTLRKKSRRDSSLSMTNLLRTIYEFAKGALCRRLLDGRPFESGRLYHEDDRVGQTRGHGRGRSPRPRRVLVAFGPRI